MLKDETGEASPKLIKEFNAALAEHAEKLLMVFEISAISAASALIVVGPDSSCTVH